jgi:hypothetical protein
MYDFSHEPEAMILKMSGSDSPDCRQISAHREGA